MRGDYPATGSARTFAPAGSCGSQTPYFAAAYPRRGRPCTPPSPTAPVAVYTISDLAKLSGVKAPTLRVWERRYGILQPKRTPANARYYDDEDVRHLLNVALLNRAGMRISRIAELSPRELARRAAEQADVGTENSLQLDALTLSMLEMDEDRFERILDVNEEQLGFEATMMTVILPFLDKLSVLWLTGSVKPVQELFTSGLIRRKLTVAIEALPRPDPAEAPRLLLFLPEGETQEMSLMLLHYLARSRGYRVYYLGRDIGVGDLEDAAPIVRPDLVFAIATETFRGGSIEAYARRARAAVAPATLLLSGYQATSSAIAGLEGVRVLPSMPDTLHYLETFLAEHRAQRRGRDGEHAGRRDAVTRIAA